MLIATYPLSKENTRARTLEIAIIFYRPTPNHCIRRLPMRSVTAKQNLVVFIQFI